MNDRYEWEIYDLERDTPTWDLWDMITKERVATVADIGIWGGYVAFLNNDYKEFNTCRPDKALKWVEEKIGEKG